MGRDVHQSVDVALARMSPLERAAFVLRHFEGRSLNEIARALDQDANAVKQSICRAVRKAREVLAPLAGATP
jgi:RNA polymerase sigma-70 factor (ECF subfamily)